MNKYYNKRTTIDGYEFDSKAEARRYQQLKILEKAGQIKRLELQPRYLLQESFKKGKKTHRKIEYIADFRYIENKKIIVEDVKGKETDVFKIKRKLFEYKYPDIEFRITKWREK